MENYHFNVVVVEVVVGCSCKSTKGGVLGAEEEEEKLVIK